MRVLWICNVVLSDFAAVYGINETPFGGWMEGMLYTIERHNTSDNVVVDVSLAFPIYNEMKRHDGIYNGHRYYSFNGEMDRSKYFMPSMTDEFIRIMQLEKPDVIHIWGTEYPHARAVIEAAKRINMLDRLLVHIQGLVSICSLHYSLGVPEKYLDLKSGKFPSIREGMENFRIRGEDEKAVLRDVQYVLGRTEWDKACAAIIGGAGKYSYVEEIMRDEIYDMTDEFSWDLSHVERHSIFLSQASYPVKGIHYFLYALASIVEKCPDVVVYIGGTDPTKPDNDNNISGYGQFILDIIKEMNLKKYIHFLGLLSAKEMVEQYFKANVFVSSSTIENSSNSIIEAMMVGTPVIASYVGGTPSLIEHKKTGFLYSCDESYLLAYYVISVFEDDEMAIRLSHKAYHVMKMRHDREKILHQLMAIYDEIIKQNNVKSKI